MNASKFVSIVLSIALAIGTTGCGNNTSTWESTKAGAHDAATWCGEHKKEIAVTAAVVAATAAGAYLNQSAPPEDESSYSKLPDGPNVGEGQPFTQSQKAAILQANMARNDGVLRSDLSGQPLVAPQQYSPGYCPPANEAQVDHIYPRSLGGANSFGNAQVLSRQENLLKGASVPSGK